MICAECGGRVPKGNHFCEKCGEPIGHERPPTDAPENKDAAPKTEHDGLTRSYADSTTSAADDLTTEAQRHRTEYTMMPNQARFAHDHDMAVLDPVQPEASDGQFGWEDSSWEQETGDSTALPSRGQSASDGTGGLVVPGGPSQSSDQSAGATRPPELPSRIGLWVAAGAAAVLIIAAAIAIPLLVQEGNPGDSGGGLVFSAGDTTTTTTPAASSTVSAPPSAEAAPATTAAGVPAGDGIDSDYDTTTIQSLPDPVDLAPEAHILSPSQAAAFTADSQDAGGGWYINVTLEGQGLDPEDGTLPDARLKWSDSVNDGPARVIGTGSQLTVPLAAPNVSGNTHKITLTVTDSHDHTAAATITITVSQFF